MPRRFRLDTHTMPPLCCMPWRSLPESARCAVPACAVRRTWNAIEGARAAKFRRLLACRARTGASLAVASANAGSAVEADVCYVCEEHACAALELVGENVLTWDRAPPDAGDMPVRSLGGETRPASGCRLGAVVRLSPPPSLITASSAAQNMCRAPAEFVAAERGLAADYADLTNAGRDGARGGCAPDRPLGPSRGCLRRRATRRTSAGTAVRPRTEYRRAVVERADIETMASFRIRIIHRR